MRGNKLFGSETVKLSLDIVTKRSTPATSPPTLAKAVRTEFSNPNNKNAATTDSRVNSVRVLRLKSAVHKRWKYFTQAPPAAARPACPYRDATRDGRIRRPSDRASP